MTRTVRSSRRLVGHRDAPLGRSPFGPAVPSIVAALLYGMASLVWAAAGGSLPGGRWLSIHLFTLGVLTNLLLAFTDHFARTLTRTNVPPSRWIAPVANVGVASILVGLPSQTRWATGGGAVIVTIAVTWSYVRLRRMRKQAIGARFGWIVRVYERAHGAFIHGAALGLLMGIGALSGAWYPAARLAHLHVNILGWAGLTILATLVFFGPTTVRTRILPGADDRAARALRRGATGLTIAVLLLLATGIGDPAAVPIRMAAAAALAPYAWAGTVVCRPVTIAAARANSSARWPVTAASLWFPAVAWADVAVIATGTWRLLDAIGLAMLIGVLVQVITATLTYLAPQLRARSFHSRDRLLARLEAGATVRSLAFNAGAALMVTAAVARNATGASLGRTGGTLIVLSMIWLLVAATAPTPGRRTDSTATSRVASRYRASVADTEQEP